VEKHAFAEPHVSHFLQACRFVDFRSRYTLSYINADSNLLRLAKEDRTAMLLRIFNDTTPLLNNHHPSKKQAAEGKEDSKAVENGEDVVAGEDDVQGEENGEPTVSHSNGETEYVVTIEDIQETIAPEANGEAAVDEPSELLDKLEEAIEANFEAA